MFVISRSVRANVVFQERPVPPLENEEVIFLQQHYSKIKPFLNKKGITSIEAQGVFVKGIDGDYETPLVKGKECAYTVFSETRVASCGI